MLSTNTLLILLFAVCCIGVVVFMRKKNNDERIFIKEVSFVKELRTIKATGLTEDVIRKAIDDYEKICIENGDHLDYKPQIRFRQEQGAIFIDLPASVTFTEYSLLMNYLIYSNKEQKHNDKFEGTYKFGEVDTNGLVNFSNQVVKVFIPSSDKSYDNIHFLLGGRHYMQTFTDWSITLQ